VDVLFREDVTVDEFIDVVLGNRVYLRCLYVINKSQQQHITQHSERAGIRRDALGRGWARGGTSLLR
jgi:ribosome-interacting GTPase 1